MKWRDRTEPLRTWRPHIISAGCVGAITPIFLTMKRTHALSEAQAVKKPFELSTRTIIIAFVAVEALFIVWGVVKTLVHR